MGPSGGPGTSDPGRMTFSSMTLASLVSQAYDVLPFQLSCADWLYTARFDIIAKVPEGATKEQISIMLRNLLEDRFQLKVRQETKDMPILELSIARGGPKLKAAAGDSTQQEAMSGEPVLDKDGFPQIPRGQSNMLVVDGRARWQAPGAHMDRLTRMLSRELGKPVTDATGLRGNYDLSLYWVTGDAHATSLVATSDAEVAAPTLGATDAVVGPTIFGAIKAQLGLRLDPKKGAASILVVDSAARVPTGN